MIVGHNPDYLLFSMIYIELIKWEAWENYEEMWVDEDTHGF